jgi:hypothetical protein
VPAGYSVTPLPGKLGIREGHRVVVLGDPGHAAELLDGVPAGVRVVHDPPLPREARAGRRSAVDVVVAFVPEARALARRFRHGHRLIDWAGGLWIAWPKMRSPLYRDLRESQVREHGLAAGLVDNKVCAIDEDWSGLRFVYRREDRG